MPDDVRTLSQKPGTKLGHSTAKHPVMVEGRRDFFTYRGHAGLGLGQLGAPTGWHYHVCEHQFVYVLNGWVELEFEGGEMLRCGSGDTVYIPGGLKHNELRTSDDFEILEISTPGEIGTVPCDQPAA